MDKRRIPTFSNRWKFCQHNIDMTAEFSSFGKWINLEFPLSPPDRHNIDMTAKFSSFTKWINVEFPLFLTDGNFADII